MSRLWRRSSVVLGALLAVGVVAAACGDPTHEAEVAALGPEAANVSPGPTHRPGQPCLTCHGGEGPGDVVFVTAGTVYVNQYVAPPPHTKAAANEPLNGGIVHLVDANGSTFDATTNNVGNFFVTTDQWSPTFPLGARSMDAGIPPQISADAACDPATKIPPYAGEISVSAKPATGCATSPTPMISTIDRSGVYASCAYCHFDPPGPTSPGHVYLQ